MPITPPNNPPSGTYTSVLGTKLSAWDGTFDYDSTTKDITYTVTATNDEYAATNTSNGNAFVFSIDDGTTTVSFDGANFTNPNGQYVYTGTAHSHADPTGVQDGWTATQ